MQSTRLERVCALGGQLTLDPGTFQIVTMKVSKGLGFPVVALPGVGHMPAAGQNDTEAARVFYVAPTRAMQRLVIGVGGLGGNWELVKKVPA